jgi:hypothetical protein
MDVVLGHWNTWEDDALILDKANNRFADSAKVHRLDHVGHYFQSRGPFSVPRSPRKGIPCSSRRVNPAAASLLPRSGPTWCL